MKKCSFISIIRKYNSEDDSYAYDVKYDIKPYGEFSELVTSLNKFEKIEIVDFKNLSYDVNLFISFFCMDSGDYFDTFVSNLLKPLVCKTIFLDFSTYDNQEIGEEELNSIEKLTDKPIYFITKNLLQNRSNHLYFEELCYHMIFEKSEIPRCYDSYSQIKKSQSYFWSKYKGFCYAGHTRFHKVEFLEFLYQNKYLDELVWSCTSADLDPPVIRDFVPLEYEEKFNSFEVIKLLPKVVDGDISTKEKYHHTGASINFATYLDSCFEIVPETRFYEQSGKFGTAKTYNTWNNISEKIMKPSLLGHPFILLSKSNTISSLKDRGINYEYDFWKFEYDSIEDNNDRMIAIQEFTKKVMKMSIKELSEFNRDYYEYCKPNYKKFIDGIYKNPINNIWKKL
jgi:hypothetical protein